MIDITPLANIQRGVQENDCMLDRTGNLFFLKCKVLLRFYQV